MLTMTDSSNNKDSRCREVLSALLNQQLERNEELEAQNLQLEEEQRRLLSILQGKDDEIERMVNSKQGRGNDSTLQMTQLGREKQCNEEMDRQLNITKGRVNNLQNAVREKEEEMERLRNYYSDVIDRLQQEHRQKEEEDSSHSEEAVRVLKQEVKKLRGENNGLHEVILKSNQKTRQLSQQIIMGEQELQELGLFKKVAEERKERIERLERQLELSQRDCVNKQRVIEAKERQIDDKLLDIKFQFGEKEMIKQKEMEEKFSKQKKQSEEKLQRIKSQEGDKLIKMKEEFQERINFMISRSQEEKQELRQKYVEEAKTCILAELQNEAEDNQAKMSQLDVQLKETQLRLISINEKYEQQSQLVINLEDDLRQTKANQGECEKELKKLRTQLEDKKIQFRKMQEKYVFEKENGQYLQASNNKQSEEIKQKDQKYNKTANQLKRVEINCKKANCQIQELKQNLEVLNDELKNVNGDLQMKTDEVDRLNTKLAKESERKDKLLAENRKIIKDQEVEIEEYKIKVRGYEEREEKQVDGFNQKVKEMKEWLNKSNEEKTKLTRQNKKMKEDISSMQERVKTAFLECDRKIEELKQQKTEAADSNKSLLVEKQNYRKLYETNASDLAKAKDKLAKYQQKIQKLSININNYQQEIQCLKEQITSQQIISQDKLENDRYRQEIIDLKAKINHNAEIISKLKKENAELTRDTIVLHEDNQKMRDTEEKIKNKVVLIGNEKNKLEERVRNLQEELEQRCQKMESDMPYINTLIDQKKLVESELQKTMNQVKRKDHLLEVAKRSKAQELMNLTKECGELRKKQKNHEKELQELKTTVEQMNREKVKTYREATNLQDYVRKIQKQNKALKAEVKKMGAMCDQQQKQIQRLYQMMATIDSSHENM